MADESSFLEIICIVDYEYDPRNLIFNADITKMTKNAKMAFHPSRLRIGLKICKQLDLHPLSPNHA